MRFMTLWLETAGFVGHMQCACWSCISVADVVVLHLDVQLHGKHLVLLQDPSLRELALAWWLALLCKRAALCTLQTFSKSVYFCSKESAIT